MLKIPNNLLKLANRYCMIHSFAVFVSFRPLITYAHRGFIQCNNDVFGEEDKM